MMQSKYKSPPLSDFTMDALEADATAIRKTPYLTQAQRLEMLRVNSFNRAVLEILRDHGVTNMQEALDWMRAAPEREAEAARLESEIAKIRAEMKETSSNG